jgi:hypothetical protein
MTNNYAGLYSFRSRFADIDIPRIMKDVPETCNIVQIQVGKQVLFATRASMRKRGFDANIQMQTKDFGLIITYQICSILYPVVSVNGKFKLGCGKITDEKWNFCIREVGEESRNQMDWYIDFFNRVEEHYKKLNRVVVRYYNPEKTEVKPIEEVSPIKVGDLVKFIKPKAIIYNKLSTFRVTSICHDYCTIDQPSCYEDGDTICRLSNLVKV